MGDFAVVGVGDSGEIEEIDRTVTHSQIIIVSRIFSILSSSVGDCYWAISGSGWCTGD